MTHSPIFLRRVRVALPVLVGTLGGVFASVLVFILG
jgi:hypothetical protein